MAESTTRILGYADRLSVAPGERLELKVSCTGIERYRLDFVRIVCGDPDPRGPGLRLVPAPSPVDGEHPGRFQPIDAGSYVRIDDTSGLPDGTDFSVAAFIWPTAPGGHRQTVLGWWSEPDRAGLALELDERGALGLRLGTGAAVLDAKCTEPLLERRWYFAAASFDAQTGAVRVDWSALDGAVGVPAPRRRCSTEAGGARPPPIPRCSSAPTAPRRPTAAG